jgi:hypothetical protein
MPSSSKKQHNFMAAVANNPAFAKKVGVPQSVGKDFSNADKGRKFSKGGDTMASKMNPGMMAMMAKKKPMKMAEGGMTMVNKGGKMVPDFAADGKGKMAKGGMAKMGAVKTAKPSMGSASSRADGIAQKGKTKGKILKKGGMAC